LYCIEHLRDDSFSYETKNVCSLGKIFPHCFVVLWYETCFNLKTITLHVECFFIAVISTFIALVANKVSGGLGSTGYDVIQNNSALYCLWFM
jgi:hypothetical protein